MIKVIVNGAKGKMGQATVEAVKTDSELELVGETDLSNDLAKTIIDTKAQIVVDFTTPAARIENIQTILTNGATAVVGTTGFSDKDLKEVEKMCKDNKAGALIAPNFGIGAVLMMQYAADAAQYLPNVEIVEYHHDNKADAPSGTAIKTAQLINEKAGETNKPNTDSEEVLDGYSQGAQVGNVRIHAVRLPGFVASQEVILGGIGQTLKIRHDTVNRESFMPGVVLACKKMVDVKELVYGLEKIL